MFKKALSIMLSLMLVVSAFSMAVVPASAAVADDSVNANADTEVAPVGDDVLTVKATSNLFPETTYTFTKDELTANNNKVTITYFINSAKDMLNSQWALTYDEDQTGLLTVNEADNITENEDEEIISTVMPKASDAVINFETSDATPTIRGNCTKLGLYKLSKKGDYVPFVSVTFTANGTGNATVNLDIEEMAVSKLQPGKTQTQDEDEEQLITNSTVNDEVTFEYTTGTDVYAGADKKDTYTEPEQPTTVEETTVEETTAEPTTVEPTTIEETTVEETTVEETTVEETTEAPEETTAAPVGDDKLNVKVTSNLFGESIKSYDASTKQITVVYEMSIPGYAFVNSDVTFTYDPAVFKYASSNKDEELCPVAGSLFVCTPPTFPVFGEEGIITGNFSEVNNRLKAYNADGTPVTFFKVVLDVNEGASGDTTVDLNFKNLRICPEDKLPENDSELIIKKNTLQVPEEELEKMNLNDYSTDGKEEEPTTEEPTEPASEPPVVEDHIYSVAGSNDALGNWDATNVSTEMTKGDDGLYTFTTPMDAENGVMFKVVEDHSWDVAYGDENGNNVVFNVKEPCDVTITFNPETKEINVTGTGVEYPISFEIDAIRAVGNGDGNWLNGAAWDPADDSNIMTEVSDKVYEITFENVDASFAYQVKCAANGSWAANWGTPKDSGFTPEVGVPFDAGWDGDNANFEVEEDGATVKIQLDLREFDYATKQGAKMTISVDYPGEEPTEEATTVEPTTEEPTTVEPTTEEPTTVEPTTEEPTTVEPTTEEPTTVEPTTEEPTTAEPTTEEPTTVEPTTEEPTTVEPTTEEPTTEAPKLKVNAISNFFNNQDLGEKTIGENFTLSYDYQQPDEYKIVSASWRLEYDPAKVSIKNVTTFDGGEYSYINLDEAGVVRGNFSNIDGFDFSTEKNFVTFDIEAVDGGEETLNFVMEDLFNEKWVIVENEVIKDKPEEPTEPTTEEPTEEPTEVPTEPLADADFVINAGTVTAEPTPGTEVRVPVEFAKNPGYGYGYVRANWDVSQLVLQSVEYNSALAPAQASAAPINPAKGTYKVSFGDMMTLTPFEGTDTAFTLVFKVADTATEGNVAITLTEDEVYTVDIETIESAVNNGKVILAKEVPTQAPTEEPTTVAPEEPTTVAPEEPTTVAPEEPTTVAPEEPTTVAPEEPTTVAPEEPTTVAPEEPTTVAPEEPTTVAPEEPTTVAPEEPTTVAPEEPTTVAPEEPTTVAPEEPTTAPEETTVAPEETTVAPEETTVAPEEETTVEGSTDATSSVKPATGDSTSDSTKDSSNGGSSNGGTNGAVQTGNASMAIIILLVLISATGAIYFARKRVK